MKRILLVQLDGKMPNLALMRLSAHHKALGDSVTLRRAMNASAVERQLYDEGFDRVYGSLIFDISSDGKRIVFDRSRDNSDVVLIDVPRPDGR